MSTDQSIKKCLNNMCIYTNYAILVLFIKIVALKLLLFSPSPSLWENKVKTCARARRISDHESIRSFSPT